MLKVLDSFVKIVAIQFIINMDVYIYIKPTEVVILSGLLSTNTLVTGEELTLRYSTTPVSNLVMVSLTADQFVYLQDQGVLVTEELLLN